MKKWVINLRSKPNPGGNMEENNIIVMTTVELCNKKVEEEIKQLDDLFQTIIEFIKQIHERGEHAVNN